MPIIINNSYGHNSFRSCLNYAVLTGRVPWRTRYPLSSEPI